MHSVHLYLLPERYFSFLNLRKYTDRDMYIGFNYLYAVLYFLVMLSKSLKKNKIFRCVYIWIFTS